MIARGAVLFVRALVFLVDDDEAQVAKRREQGASRTDHHARRARPDEIPLVVTLALAHARVHDGNRVAETAAEAGNRLRGKRDLGHQNARRAALGKHKLDGLQIDLGFPRTGNAVDQDDIAASSIVRFADNAQRLGLAGRERGFLRWLERAGLDTAHTTAALDAHHAVRFECLQNRRHRTELHGQLGHAQLALTQCLDDRDLLHRVLSRRERIGVGAKHHPTIVHFADSGLFKAPLTRARAHDTGNSPGRRE